MSPRPRTVSDQDILTAAGQVAARAGPARFTLAAVAKQAGLSPATLVQRFGSKLGLMRAMARAWVGWIPAEIHDFRARHRSPLGALRAYLVCFSKMARTPRDLAHHLGFLQMDLTDPVLSKLMRDGSRLTERGVTAIIREAVDRKELVHPDPAQLARTLLAVVTGALLAWASRRDGTAEAWLTREVGAALAPHLAGPGRQGSRPVPATNPKRKGSNPRQPV